jgi:LPS-assembly protein
VIRYAAALLLVLLFAARGLALEQIGFADAGTGDESPLQLTARSLTNTGANEVVAEGDVRVTWGEHVITADKIVYNRSEQLIRANGNVVMVDASKNKLTCEAAEVNVEDLTGWASYAEFYLPETGYRIKADHLKRTGPRTLEAENASFSACDGTWPSWRIDASWLSVELEGYLYGKHGVFWMESAPAIYLPVFLFPAKLQRQTGFLTPRMGYSDVRGYRIENRFFWTISESADLLLKLDYRSRLGWIEEARARYILGDGHAGSFMLRHYDTRTPETDNALDFEAEHLSTFSSDTLFDMNVEYAGDKKTRQDFADDLEALELTRLEGHAVGAHTIDYGTFYALGRFTQPLVGAQSAVMQELPGAGFMGVETPLWGPLFTRSEAEATRFHRKEGEKGIRVRGLQELGAAYSFGPLGVVGQVGYRQHYYDQKVDGSAAATVENGNGSRGAAFSKVRAWLGLERAYGGYLHMVEPRVVYSWTEEGRGIQPLQFDDEDTFENSSIFSVGFESRLYDLEDERLLLLVDLERDLEVGEISKRGLVGDALLPWRGELGLYVTDYLSLDADGEYDSDNGEDWLRWAAEARLSDWRGDSIWYKQQYLKGEANHLEVGGSLVVTDAITANYSNRYSRKEHKLLEEKATLAYTHPCWQLMLNFSRTYRVDDGFYDKKIMLSYTLKGLGKGSAVKW